MSFLMRIVPNFLRSGSMGLNAPSSSLLPSQTTSFGISEAVQSLGLFGQSIRTVIRCHFPRPSERKRIKRHGYKARMSTPGGRRVIMRRILKGRYVITH